MILAPLSLVSAHQWQRVTFTTYALSLSFFEAVILDALIRGGGRQALILADIQGIRASLSEQGAQRVGKDYEVEPVAVSSGVFHPKITVLSGNGECHLLVGSGNLTFNGWGGNCEVLEHLHPSFAADAFADAADFFELLSVTERVRFGASAYCDATAADLRASIVGQPRNGDIRLLHSLDRSISEQLIEIAKDLGGASRLVAAAPFWDKGAAIDRLSEALGLDHVFIHAHAFGTVEGTAGANWPAACRSAVHPVRLDTMQDERRLHAKAFEIMCTRGRVLVSGSANATGAALGTNCNVEACIVRIHRERVTGWTFVATEAPEPQAAPEVETEKQERCGILRAVLEAETVRGEILTSAMRGQVSVYYVSRTGQELLAETTLSEKGHFEVSAPALEQKSWLGGRLVIRVVDEHDRKAEGFVSVASFTEITRRAGPAVRSLLAILAGTETPSDVAAMMGWFHEDPSRLVDELPHGIGRSGKDPNGPDKPSPDIVVADLSGPTLLAARVAGHKSPGGSWSRFMEHILAAFRQKRGPFGSASSAAKDDDDNDSDNDGNNNDNKDNKDKDTEKDVKVNNAANEQSLANFQKLFDLLLKPGGDARQALIAFDLAQYICKRLLPERLQAIKWLKQLIKALLERGVPPERRHDVAAAILILLGASVEHCSPRWARGHLLDLEFDIGGDAPSSEGAEGFQAARLESKTFAEFWPQVQAIRTYQEQARSFLDALDGKTPSGEFAELEQAAKEEWPTMKTALGSKDPYRRIIPCRKVSDFCPRCYIGLPSGEVGKLNSIGIATAKNCCRKVLIVARG